MMKPDDSTLESAIKSRIMILEGLHARVSAFEIRHNIGKIPTISFECRSNFKTNYEDIFETVGAWLGTGITDSSFSVICELSIKDKESMLFIGDLH